MIEERKTNTMERKEELKQILINSCGGSDTAYIFIGKTELNDDCTLYEYIDTVHCLYYKVYFNEKDNTADIKWSFATKEMEARKQQLNNGLNCLRKVIKRIQTRKPRFMK